MAKLKKNLNNITDDTKVLVEDYLRLFSGKFSEKLALFLGILASVFVLFTLIMILVIFSSFTLAGYLSKVLPGEYWGFGIVSGIYLLTIVFFIVKIFRTKTQKKLRGKQGLFAQDWEFLGDDADVAIR